ncbi:uncharacterized protein PV09_00751 [Verruconis gallopava]|uniref:Pentatricopeptide repeat-containing protein-mitochondrial domain-containing protein n=1 Tax=Verruconis gallopava TaxID=253628 RepID=A0A0D1Y173_9PEZI|nr:uncharacterized protein PV09_00751 [Verruconis gallopava]KIW08821.1 hypothetical protein PV09_00751 [Verruconis gallopava]
MSHARPVTRLVTESLQSLPWTRSSITLGRPYRVQYRFRPFSSHVRYLHRFALADGQREYELLEQQQQAQLTRPFAPWEAFEGDGFDDGKSVANKPANVKRNTLALAEDTALQLNYDVHVAVEEAKIQGRTASELYDILRIAAGEGSVPSIFKVQACINVLIKEHGEQPNLRLYSALILAQCRADGSVAVVERLLDEMSRDGFELDIGACHDVLKVLSVHPDYLLRSKILLYMRNRWFQLSYSGWHDVAASLIREGSLEIAMDYMDDMRREGIRILGWLYDMMIYALAEREEMDEVLRLLRQRVTDGDLNISPTLWYYLLDVSSRVLHYDLASYIWKSRVKTHHLNPPSGTCANLMNLAARNGDPELAQDVFEFLGKRDTVFEPQHYEMIIEAYVNVNMPENGFYVLSAMQEANVLPSEGTTRRLLVWLRAHPERTQHMYNVLCDIKEKGGPIPVAAMNVLIEAAVHHRKLDQAIDLYKAIPEMCMGSANLATFNALLKLCRQLQRKDLALTLASEMVALRVMPDAMTYDRMMLVCLIGEDYEDGLRYYMEMRAKRFEPRFGSALMLVKTLTKWGDKRVYGVLEDLAVMDLPLRVNELRRWVKENFGKKEHVKLISYKGDDEANVKMDGQ